MHHPRLPGMQLHSQGAQDPEGNGNGSPRVRNRRASKRWGASFEVV